MGIISERTELVHENITLKAKLKTILELSKDNADAAEYCIRELEEKLDKVEDICKKTIDKRPHSDNSILEEILKVIRGEQ